MKKIPFYNIQELIEYFNSCNPFDLPIHVLDSVKAVAEWLDHVREEKRKEFEKEFEKEVEKPIKELVLNLHHRRETT